MPFEWTADMPAVCTHQVTEPYQRMAISVAAAAMDALMYQERERPAFNGGHYATPANETAHELVAAIEGGFAEAEQQGELTIDDSLRRQMITVAVRAADQIWRESQEAGVTMERYWPRFVQRFGIHRGPRPEIRAPFPPEPVEPVEPG